MAVQFIQSQKIVAFSFVNDQWLDSKLYSEELFFLRIIDFFQTFLDIVA